ncbi:MAG: DNA polymerase IV [Acidimicrobiales bacterium]
MDDPGLVGRPVIVGGIGSRGVVAACTYEARMFGVHSAMPSTAARHLCPHAVFIQGRYHRYADVSSRLHQILETATPLVEGISLDEAFLDVTGTLRLLGDATTIASDLRRRVREELNLSCSVGVGPNKLLAKLASKAAKPVADRSGVRPGAGIVTVEAGRELEFLHPLPVEALWGVGPVTERRLKRLGIRSVGDLAALSPGTLERHFGTGLGSHLSALCRGEDQRRVIPDQRAKSIGHEETFVLDIWDRDQLWTHLTRMVDAAVSHLREASLASRTITVKIKFGDFTSITRSHSLVSPVDSVPAISAVARALFDSVDLSQGVRLLGISLSGFGDCPGGTQLSLDLDVGDPGPREGRDATASPTKLANPGDPMARAGLEAERLQLAWGEISVALDSIRDRYGRASVGMASTVGVRGLQVSERGAAQWGPTGAGNTGSDQRPDSGARQGDDRRG